MTDEYKCKGRLLESFNNAPLELRQNTQFGCEHPEGMRTPFTAYCDGCKGCEIAAQASIVLQGDMTFGRRDDAKGKLTGFVMLSDQYPPDPNRIREAIKYVEC